MTYRGVNALPTRLLLLACIVAMAISPRARADLFVGAKAGPMQLDRSGSDAPLNAALAVWADLDVMLLDFGILAEVTRTVDDGATSGGEDIAVETAALYLTIKSPGTVYVKFRGGLLDERVTTGDAASRQRQGSFGTGLGIHIGKVRIELEYTIGDQTEYLSLGLQFLVDVLDD